jgi:hypothetical protein
MIKINAFVSQMKRWKNLISSTGKKKRMRNITLIKNIWIRSTLNLIWGRKIPGVIQESTAFLKTRCMIREQPMHGRKKHFFNNNR